MTHTDLPSPDVPVVLVAFNRPEHVRRTLERIRQAAPSRLFLVVDAPRPDRPEDVAACAAVRRELEAVDWDCRVERRYAESNLGCEASIELGLDWVFSAVDRAIVLEDDCVADPTFFRFCAELLERYAGDERVWQIAGSVCPVPRDFFGEDSYAFTRMGAVWGWATWARAWKAHRAGFTRDHATAGSFRTMPPRRAVPAVVPRGTLETEAGVRFYTDVAASTGGDDFGWDCHFWLSIISAGGFAISPSANLVENIGVGADATHTRTERATAAAEPMTFPLRHPPTVAVNHALARDQELNLVRGQGRLARIAGRILGRGPLRRLASRVSTSPVTWRVVRAVAAARARLRRTAP